MDRRGFLSLAAGAGCALLCPGPSAAAVPPVEAREAMWYQRMAGGMVRCTLCPCGPAGAKCGLLRDGETCTCRVRFNRGGKLYTTTYGRPSIMRVEPIEKNPIYHMRPGLRTLALGTAGCTLACKCCQNWQLSQAGVESVRSMAVPPARAAEYAVEAGCGAVTFTYTEPAVFYEYALDTAIQARRRGLRTAMATGGYILPAPLRALTPHIDMFSVSVKAFTEEAYRDVLGGQYATVLEALRTLAAARAWLEIVVLPIPTVSDDPAQIAAFCGWVRGTLGPDVPVHFLRFVPEYRLRHLPPTPVALLDEARRLARKAGLRHVYVGNLPGHEGANTVCPSCRRTLVVRVGMSVVRNAVVGGKCPGCGTRVPGVWA